jgi:hypothetical protein
MRAHNEPLQLTAVVDWDVDGACPLDLDRARILKDRVAGHHACASWRFDSPAHARRPVAKALVEGMFVGEAAP